MKRLALVVVLAGCASAEGRSAPLVNGAPATDEAIVAVVHTRPDGTRQLCSGTVVGPRAVLTAKHCVFEDMGGAAWVAIPSGDLSIVLGDDIVGAPGASIAVRAVDTTAGPYRDGDGARGGDIAILTLASDAPAAPLPVASAAPMDGAPLRLVGFGYTEAGSRGTLGTRHAGMAAIVSVAAETFTTEGASWTCVGDSGGPALDASGAVLGVTSIGPRGCPSSTSIFTRIDTNGELLARAGVLPTPDAGTGDAGTDAPSAVDGPPGDGGSADPPASGCAVRPGADNGWPIALLLAVVGARRRSR